MKTNNEFKIEHGILVPPPQGTRTTEIGSVLDRMKVGDSVVMPRAKMSTTRNAARYRGMILVTRRIDSEHLRVWFAGRNYQKQAEP